VLERMLAGVATRRRARTAEPVGAQIEQAATSTGRSGVSCRFARETETALAELPTRDLDGEDIKVAARWGTHKAGRCVIVALASAPTAPSSRSGCGTARRRNKTVVRSLLADLVSRLCTDDWLLVVTGGSKRCPRPPGRRR
jgi:hypothetical protein